jgi:hyperosmotically inducible protein
MNFNSLRSGAKWLALATFVAVAGCASDNTSQGPVSKAGTVVDDSMITAKVKTAFVADKDVGALNIGVDTTNGVVRLTGSGSETEARRAAQLASNVEGVKSVQNEIKTN